LALFGVDEHLEVGRRYFTMRIGSIQMVAGLAISLAIIWYTRERIVEPQRALEIHDGPISVHCVYPEAPAPQISTDDYLIYRTYISDHIGTRDTVIVSIDTVLYRAHVDKNPSDILKYFSRMSNNESEFSPELSTLEGFVHANTVQVQLDEIEFSYLPIVLTSADELHEKIFLEDTPLGVAWEKLGPSSVIVRFSRVGFNCDHSEAMIYVSESCGSLCGGGWYVLFRKEDQAWRVSEKYLIWIS
jgi:hypothetical protein